MDFNKMKVAELKSFLESKGLPKLGNKQALIERAMTYYTHLQKNLKLDSEKQEREVQKKEGESDEPEMKKMKTMDEDMTPENTPPEEENTQIKEEKPPVVEEDVVLQPVPGTEAEAVAKASTSTEEEEWGKGQSGVKRRHKKSPVGPIHKKSRPLEKTPLQYLYEKMPGLDIEVEEGGLLHQKVFTAKLTHDEKEYSAEGSSKKAAKQELARKLLRAIDPMFVPTIAAPTNGHQIDFTSDSPAWFYGENFAVEKETGQSADSAESSVKVVEPAQPKELTDEEKETILKAKQKKILGKAAADKNPLQLLNELLPGLKFERYGEENKKTYSMKAIINGVEYRGEGQSKKSAKRSLAVKALKEQFGILSNCLPDLLPVQACDDGSEPVQVMDAGNLPDLVYELVKEKFKMLMDGYEPAYTKCKVLAGIVMTRENGPNVKEGKVICVASGTKCISGGHVSHIGTALNDCHAEIICRRGLRRFLYLQLLLHSHDKENSIFEPCSDGNGFRLKPDVFFHLYISTSPCGDSRIFSPHETKEQNDDHPNRKARGQLRTKIEAGEGTLPVQEFPSMSDDGMQMWDAIVAGERLRTMSCSDKLAGWNLLGLQGSLLSLFIEPVYLSSIILGSLYHSSHFTRGVYTRVRDSVNVYSAELNKDIEGNDTEARTQIVKEPFKLHRPFLASLSVPDNRQASKASTFCVHWTIGDDEPSIIDTVTGKWRTGIPSNLCKMAMLHLFRSVVSEDDMKKRIDFPNDAPDMIYGDIKKFAEEYQRLKENLQKGFKVAGFGIWVKKPREVDDFLCSDWNPEKE